tara:strand:- start:938 stop:1702 length:765 start_codon:yes stop_codon:yes gene_type:complete
MDKKFLSCGLGGGLDIKLISTVHGPTEIRAKIAKKFTQELNHDIPVAIGEQYPIKQPHILITGLEGKDYIKADEKFNIETNAVDKIIQTIYENKGIDIAALGPLTNIAKALKKDSNLENYINHIYIMGNALQTKDNVYLNYRSHNLKADPEAADIVFNAQISKTIITTEVCKKNFLTRDELCSLGKNTTLNYIVSAGKEWLDYIKADVAYLYDPLVIHHLIDDNITKKITYGQARITTDVKPFKNKLLKVLLDG